MKNKGLNLFLKISLFCRNVLKFAPSFILCLVIASGAFAQNGYTLAAAIEYGMKHRTELVGYALDKSLAAEQVRAAQNVFLPRVDGALDVRDNAVRATSILPGELRGKPGEQLAVQFGTQYSTTASASVNQAVYDATLLPRYRQLKLQAQTADLNAAQMRQEIALNITKAYYQTLLDAERLKVARASVSRYNTTLEQVRTQLEGKRATNTDVKRAELNLRTAQSDVQHQEELLAVDNATLAYQMGSNTNPTLTDKLEEVLVNNIATPIDGGSTAKAETRPEYKAGQLQIQINEAGLAVAKGQSLPTVSLYGYVGTQAQRNEFDFFDTQKQWYASVYFGAQVKVPLFDGLTRANGIAQSRLQLERSKNNLETTTANLNYEINTATARLRAAQTTLAARKANAELAEQLLTDVRTRFAAGAAIARDVQDAEYDLTNAQTTYLATLYDVLAAKVDLDKANGTLAR